MEDAWADLRRNKRSPAVWHGDDAIADVCRTTWDWLIADPERVAAIGSRSRTCVGVRASWF